MAWIEPKTNWTSKDYFNAEDYNRMIGNLTVLKEIADTLFLGITFIEMGEEKDSSANNLFYASEFNKIEINLLNLNKCTYGLDTTSHTYRSNGATPNYVEFNRIEKNMLAIYEELNRHKQNLFRLPFRLGNQKGMRV